MMIAQPQLPTNPCTFCSSQNSGCDEDRQLAVVGGELEARADLLQLLLQLRADEHRLAEAPDRAGRHDLERPAMRQQRVRAVATAA